MTTYKFLASDSASAMEEVVKKLGPDALIVSTSKRGNKVEIEATNDFSRQKNQKDIKDNFSDVLHSKIDFLREKHHIRQRKNWQLPDRKVVHRCCFQTDLDPRELRTHWVKSDLPRIQKRSPSAYPFQAYLRLPFGIL